MDTKIFKKSVLKKLEVFLKQIKNFHYYNFLAWKIKYIKKYKIKEIKICEKCKVNIKKETLRKSKIQKINLLPKITKNIYMPFK